MQFETLATWKSKELLFLIASFSWIQDQKDFFYYLLNLEHKTQIGLIWKKGVKWIERMIEHAKQ